MAKKIVKKSKPSKNKVIKKAVKKAPAKKVASKKVTAKKPAKKVVAKKVVAKKSSAPAKKVIVKTALKPVKKIVVAAKNPPKPIAAIALAKAKPAKKVLLNKKPESESIDMEEERGEKEVSGNQPQPFFYEPPKAFIKRPDLKQPKPFIGKDKRTRYSDKELGEFKGIILGKLDEAQRDYELLKSTLSHKDDHGTDDTSPTFKLLEDGSDVMSKEETAQLASRQEKYIQSLQNALIRIENKSYGICRITGKLIPKERLRSVPHATTSIEGKMQQYA